MPELRALAGKIADAEMRGEAAKQAIKVARTPQQRSDAARLAKRITLETNALHAQAEDVQAGVAKARLRDQAMNLANVMLSDAELSPAVTAQVGRIINAQLENDPSKITRAWISGAIKDAQRLREPDAEKGEGKLMTKDAYRVRGMYQKADEYNAFDPSRIDTKSLRDVLSASPESIPSALRDIAADELRARGIDVPGTVGGGDVFEKAARAAMAGVQRAGQSAAGEAPQQAPPQPTEDPFPGESMEERSKRALAFIQQAGIDLSKATREDIEPILARFGLAWKDFE